MEPLPNIADVRIWKSLDDLYNVYWIKKRKSQTNKEFRNVECIVRLFYSIKRNNPQYDKLRVLFCIGKTLSRIDDETIKNISRISPKMTVEEKAKTVELVAKFKKEVETHRNQTIDEIFGIARPFSKLSQTSDDQLRQTISKGWDELQKLAIK